MGGQGSGRRWHIGSKSTTGDYRALDVRQLQRKGLLSTGHAFSWQWTRNGEKVASIQVRTEVDRIILSYRQRNGGEAWQDKEYPIRLEWTDCNYGGQRAWFRCPASGCGRRVAVLYGGTIFACRHCHQLAYPSQREDIASLMIRKADKIRDRLGWVPGIANGSGQKPKGMRWQTYWRLCREYGQLVNIAMSMQMQQLTRMTDSIGKSVSQKRG
jgi:hypothetical protein